MKTFLVRKALKKYRPRLVVVFGTYGVSEARFAIAAVLENQRATVAAPAETLIEKIAARFTLWQLAMVVARTGVFPEVCVISATPDSASYLQLKGILPVTCAVVMPTGDITATKNAFDGQAHAVAAISTELERAERAILVIDDKEIAACAQGVKVPMVRIGFAKEADVRIESISYTALPQKRIAAGGMSVRLTYRGAEVLLHIRDTFGKRSAYAVVAALAVGMHVDAGVEYAASDMRAYEVPNSSFRLCEGVKRTALFVHTTDVTPQSAREAIRIIGALRSAGQLRRTIIVLGDVLDPGGNEERLHRALGQLAAQHANLLYLGGERVIFAEEAARKAGMLPDNIARFDEPAQAARAAQAEINAYDGVLILGDEHGAIAQAVEELRAFDTVPKE
ncbi:MAG: hypothetical protein WD850_00175 [Candidatus Spechtbacterales bacterium]